MARWRLWISSCSFGSTLYESGWMQWGDLTGPLSLPERKKIVQESKHARPVTSYWKIVFLAFFPAWAQEALWHLIDTQRKCRICPFPVLSLDLSSELTAEAFSHYPSPLKQGITYVPWSQPEEWTKVSVSGPEQAKPAQSPIFGPSSPAKLLSSKGSILKVALCARVQTRLSRRRIRWVRGTTECISEQELVQATQRLNLPYLTCGATTVVS